MKNKLSSSLAPASALFTIALALVPVTGYCDWFSSITEVFGSKGKDMKEVATKIATLSENENIWGLDFSPDGKYLATTSPNTVSPSSKKVEVHIWEWQSGQIVHALEKAQGAYDGLTTESIRFSPNGGLLVACHSRADDNIVARIWNTATWEIVRDIVDPIPSSGCNAIGFTPDGKSLIRVLDRIPKLPQDSFFVYDTMTWQPVWGMQAVYFHSYALSISPDGKFIALGGELIDGSPVKQQILIVDITQRVIVRTINNHTTCPQSRIAWSPDGIHIAAGGCGLEIFDAHSGERVVDEKTHGGHVLIRYTPDGKYLIESGLNEGGTTVRIWDGQHRVLLQEIKAMPGSMAISRDGHYLAMGGNKKILILELK